MKNTKKILLSCAIITALAATSITALAANSAKTPAEAVSNVTGKPLAEVLTERESGKCYGTIALESGKLEEFKQTIQQFHQEQADAAKQNTENRQSYCDGTGSGCGGTICGNENCPINNTPGGNTNSGNSDSNNSGYGHNSGHGRGNGHGHNGGNGGGQGAGRRDGSCVN